MKTMVKKRREECITENISFTPERLYECLSKKKHCPYRIFYGDAGFCTHPDREKFTIDPSYHYPGVREQ